MTTERKQLSVTIAGPLVDRLDAEADARMIGKGVIVEKAVERFLDSLPPVDASLAVQAQVTAARDMGDVVDPEGT